MTRIVYPTFTEFDSKGRSGFIRTTGVEVRDLGGSDSIVLEPITSRGATSEACRIILHRSSLDRVIEALQSIKVRQAAETPDLPQPPPPPETE